MDHCPSAHDLDNFLADRLAASEAASLEAHVETCAACQKALEKQIAAPFPLQSNASLPENALTEGDDAVLAKLEKRLFSHRLQEQTKNHFLSPMKSDPSGFEAAPELAGYDVMEVLGRGGMGVVYKAWQTELKRFVAIKMVLAGGHVGSEDRARFRIEAEASGRMQHPNIVQVHEIGEQKGIPYLVLEFVKGGNLARHLGGVPMQPRQAALLLETLARAMHYAHQRGIIHRDLKPSNILLSTGNTKAAASDGKTIVPDPKTLVPKITDFGLAKMIIGGSDQTQTGAILGTPSYMAPEQAGGHKKDISIAVDVYALGAILYELMTGRPPFRGETVAQTLQKVLNQEPSAPHRWLTGIPRDLETICLKCLEKDPRRRYGSALDLAEDARRFLLDEPIRARPISPWQRLSKWAKRKPAIASLLGVVILSTALLAGGTWWYQGRLETALTEMTQERDDARQNLYLAHIPLAHRAWEAAHVKHARALLDSVQPREAGQKDFRAFEWHYLRRLLHTNLMDLTGHSAAVSAVTFRFDGQRVASAGGDGTIRIWDPEQGKELLPPLQGHAGQVTTLVYSPDGRFLASGGSDKKVCLWDAVSGLLLNVVGKHDGWVYHVAFDPSGTQLASVSADKTIKIWDLKKGGLPRTLPGSAKQVTGVAFSHDGKSLATSGADWMVRLWDLENVENVRLLSGHNGWVYSVLFSPDDKTLYSSGFDGSVHVWDTKTGAVKYTMEGHSGQIRGMALSSDGKRLATASFDRTVGIWDTASGSHLLSFKGHAGNVACVAFHPDGRRLASAGEDRAIRFWDIREFQDSRLCSRHESGPVNAVLFADNQRLFSAGADGQVQVWDMLHAKAEMPMICSKTVLTALALHPLGNILATGGTDKVAQVWDVARRKVLHQFKGHTGRISALAFHPDGAQLVSSSYDGKLWIWSLQQGMEKHHFSAHAGRVLGMAFRPDGKWLATCGDDKMVYLWDAVNWDAPLDNRRRSFKGHTGWVHCVAFSPDGKWLASGAADGAIILWEVTTGKERIRLEGHAGRVQGLAFSPDGKRLASADYFDKTVKIWDINQGQELLSLNLQSHAIGVAFSPNGHFLASSGDEPEVRIWDATPLP